MDQPPAPRAAVSVNKITNSSFCVCCETGFSNAFSPFAHITTDHKEKEEVDSTFWIILLFLALWEDFAVLFWYFSTLNPKGDACSQGDDEHLIIKPRIYSPMPLTSLHDADVTFWHCMMFWGKMLVMSKRYLQSLLQSVISSESANWKKEVWLIFQACVWGWLVRENKNRRKYV